MVIDVQLCEISPHIDDANNEECERDVDKLLSLLHGGKPTQLRAMMMIKLESFCSSVETRHLLCSVNNMKKVINNSIQEFSMLKKKERALALELVARILNLRIFGFTPIPKIDLSEVENTFHVEIGELINVALDQISKILGIKDISSSFAQNQKSQQVLRFSLELVDILIASAIDDPSDSIQLAHGGFKLRYNIAGILLCYHNVLRPSKTIRFPKCVAQNYVFVNELPCTARITLADSLSSISSASSDNLMPNSLIHGIGALATASELVRTGCLLQNCNDNYWDRLNYALVDAPRTPLPDSVLSETKSGALDSLLATVPLNLCFIAASKPILRAPNVALIYLAARLRLHCSVLLEEELPPKVLLNALYDLLTSNVHGRLSSKVFSMIYGLSCWTDEQRNELSGELINSFFSPGGKNTSMAAKIAVCSTLNGLDISCSKRILLSKYLTKENSESLLINGLELLNNSQNKCNLNEKNTIDAFTKLLKEKWSNKKLQPYILSLIFDSNVKFELKDFPGSENYPIVHLALNFKYGIFDPKSHADLLVIFKNSKIVDRFFLFSLNSICVDSLRAQIPNGDSLFTNALTSALYFAIFNYSKFCKEVLVNKKFKNPFDAFPSDSVPVNLVIKSFEDIFDKHEKQLDFNKQISVNEGILIRRALDHFKCSALMDKFFLLSHHPFLPKNLWTSFAYSLRINPVKWLSKSLVGLGNQIIEVLRLDKSWRKQAALQAIETMLLIDAESVLGLFCSFAENLVDDFRNPFESKGNNVQTQTPQLSNSQSKTAKLKSSEVNNPQKASSVKTNTLKKQVLIIEETSDLELQSVILSLDIGSVLFRSPRKELQKHISRILQISFWVQTYFFGKSLKTITDSIVSFPIHGKKYTVDTFNELLKSSNFLWKSLSIISSDEDPTLSESIRFLLCNFTDLQSSAKMDESLLSLLFRLSGLTAKKLLGATQFAVIHVILRRVYLSAMVRSETSDKVVLNRVLDHVSFLVELLERHVVLAGSPAFPTTDVLEELFGTIKMWRKYSATAQGSIVKINAATLSPSIEQVELLGKACISGNESATFASIQSFLHLGATHARKYKVLLCALAQHSLYFDLAKQVTSKYHLRIKLSSKEDVEEIVKLCQIAPLSTSVANLFGQAVQSEVKTLTEKNLDELHQILYKKYKSISIKPTSTSHGLFGGIDQQEEIDLIPSRIGVLEILAKLMPYLPADMILLKRWIAFLDEENTEVYGCILKALQIHVSAVKHSEYLSILKGFSSHKKDQVRVAVAVLIGSCVKGQDLSVDEVKEFKEILWKALQTPSESVQKAVSICLVRLPLVPQEIGNELLKALFTEKTYALQRGCSLALSEYCKEFPSLLEELNIVSAINRTKSKNSTTRQSACLLFECLVLRLRVKFEAHMMLLGPNLVSLFDEKSNTSREIAVDAISAMTSVLSAPGIRMMASKFIDAMKTDNWRIKKELLKALTSMMRRLPEDKLVGIFPTVTETVIACLKETHEQVCNTAEQVLYSFSSMIKTPEIEVLSKQLVGALIDPRKIPILFQEIRTISFHHYLDVPSLALLVPIISEGLASRVAEIRQTSAQILGSFTALVMIEELRPYSEILLSSLTDALSDAVDDTRASAAKSLGVLVAFMGIESFPGLIDGMFYQLDNSKVAIVNAGAAQGLSEIFSAIPGSQLKASMPRIIEGLKGIKCDNYLPLIVYLPSTIGNAFIKFLPVILPVAFEALGRISQYVKDCATKGIQKVITFFGIAASGIILTDLLNACLHKNQAVRQYSIPLLDEFIAHVLLKIRMNSINDNNTSIAVKNMKNKNQIINNEGVDNEDDLNNDDDNVAADHVKGLSEAIGNENFLRTLAVIHILRSDTTGSVRQTVIGIWRRLVQNSPRKVKEIFPIILEICLEMLDQRGCRISLELLNHKGDENVSGDTLYSLNCKEPSDLIVIASKTLFEILTRHAGKLVEEIFLVLQKTRFKHPVGVCRALRIIMDSIGKNQTCLFLQGIVDCILIALRNPEGDEYVLAIGGSAADTLATIGGPKSIPYLFRPLLRELPETFLGIRSCISIRNSHRMLPMIVPTIMKSLNQITSNTMARLFEEFPMGNRIPQILNSILAVHVPLKLLSLPLEKLLSEETIEESLELQMEIQLIQKDYLVTNLLGVACSIRAMMKNIIQTSSSIRLQWIRWLIFSKIISLTNKNQQQLLKIEEDEVIIIEEVIQVTKILLESIKVEEYEEISLTILEGLKLIMKKNTETSFSSYILWKNEKGLGPILTLLVEIIQNGTEKSKEESIDSIRLLLLSSPPINSFKDQIMTTMGLLIRLLTETVNILTLLQVNINLPNNNNINNGTITTILNQNRTSSSSSSTSNSSIISGDELNVSKRQLVLECIRLVIEYYTPQIRMFSPQLVTTIVRQVRTSSRWFEVTSKIVKTGISLIKILLSSSSSTSTTDKLIGDLVKILEDEYHHNNQMVSSAGVGVDLKVSRFAVGELWSLGMSFSNNNNNYYQQDQIVERMNQNRDISACVLIAKSITNNNNNNILIILKRIFKIGTIGASYLAAQYIFDKIKKQNNNNLEIIIMETLNSCCFQEQIAECIYHLLRLLSTKEGGELEEEEEEGLFEIKPKQVAKILFKKVLENLTRNINVKSANTITERWCLYWTCLASQYLLISSSSEEYDNNDETVKSNNNNNFIQIQLEKIVQEGIEETSNWSDGTEVLMSKEPVFEYVEGPSRYSIYRIALISLTKGSFYTKKDMLSNLRKSSNQHGGILRQTIEHCHSAINTFKSCPKIATLKHLDPRMFEVIEFYYNKK